jgi:probable phosphoglycerate mutase
LKNEVNSEAWTSENVATKYFWDRREGKNSWIMNTCKDYFHSSVKKYGFNWYDDPSYEGIPVKEGYETFLNNSDEFLDRHGYKHDRENCCYIAQEPNNERIAVFCHQGFGLSWLGTLLDIPLPLIWANFNFTHTGVTVVRFDGERCVPTVLTLSNDSHLYKENLPTIYNNRIYI